MKIEIDAGLPIGERADEIAEALRAHQVIVVAGETGSGKTTQLPKIAFGTGMRHIAHTQPRRIAARSVAARIAAECEVQLGEEVGYAVRFDDSSTQDTAIRLVTDGLLLSELARDPELRRYDTIIIDEAHERSLAIDFLLGYLHRLLGRRPDLKLIITSATIDVERFSEMFDAPVIEVSGRTYPVEIRYRPPSETDADDLTESIEAAIAELPRDGDVLVFCSGEREIRDTCDHLSARLGANTEIVPLYGRLTAHEQQRIFAPHRLRRIVVSTNVAETSLTVPGIRYVIDPGYARISRFSARLKVQRLPIEPISQASAAQRAGRCGRLSDGICIRLYSAEDFESRPEFTDPEIRRTNLASVLLQMASLGLGEVEDFPFLDRPDHRAVADGIALLNELGAMDGKRLTKLGRAMSRLPLDPRLARMMLAADRLGCLSEVLVIVSAMSIQDVRERPLEAQQKADELHRRFVQPDSDFIGYLKLWEYLTARRRELSHSKFRKLCHEEFLHYLRVREWSDVHAQLRQAAKDLKLNVGTTGADPDLIHRALLTGLLSHTGVRHDSEREFLGARGTRFVISPGSGLAKKPPQWVMAGELVETTRLWARDCARIDPAWIEDAAGHLLNRQYAEPAWSKRRGSATALERATLYGLPVVVDRTVMLSKVDAKLARELLIRHALVAGEWHTRHRFWHRNQEKLAEAAKLEDRVRERGLRIDDEAIFDFYDQRIPETVVSVRHFDSWFKKLADKHVLDLDPSTLVARDVNAEAFPEVWTSQSSSYDVSYRFEPSASDDGATVTIGIDELLNVDDSAFAWHVPGHRLELITELIRTLPKAERRRFVPAQDVAERILDQLDTTAELLSEVGRALDVDPALFDIGALPGHLRVRFRIVDDGQTLAQGDDLDHLRRELEPRLRQELHAHASDIERTGITGWDLGSLPHTITAGQVTGFLALVDESGQVALRILRTAEEADAAMVRGQARLISLGIADPVTSFERQLGLGDKLLLGSAPQGSAAAVIREASLCALDSLVREHGTARDEPSFLALREFARERVYERTERVVAGCLRALESVARLDYASATSQEAIDDVKVQVSWLLGPEFLREAGTEHVARLSAYLQAANRRLSSSKDLQEVYALEARFHELTADLRPTLWLTPRVQDSRWALEELRLSIVANDLRAAIPISTKRMTARLDELQTWLTA